MTGIDWSRNASRVNPSRSTAGRSDASPRDPGRTNASRINACRRSSGLGKLGGRMRRHAAAMCACTLTVIATGCASEPTTIKGDEARFAAALPAAGPDPAAASGSLYHVSTSQSLFADFKARRVGDTLTVLLVEETSASNSASTSTSRDSSVELLDPIVGGRPVTSSGTPILNTDISSSQSFAGQGQASQSNSLEGSIAVTVSDVLPNGNLIVQGEKWIKLNRGEEFIRLRGIVRPVDISAVNSVLSTQVADAELAYGGSGQVARSTAQGWLAKFFGSVLWPF